jgi:multiple sugar transport system substrate-binding protein
MDGPIAMRTRRWVLATALSGAGASTLAACGAAGQRSDTPPPSDKAPIALTWSTYLVDESRRPVFDTLQRRFMDQKGGRYTATSILLPSSEYINKTLASLAGDSAPDVFLTYAQYKPAWVKKGLLLDVTDRWKTSGKVINPKMYYPPVVEAVTYKGKQYGTPWGYNAMAMLLVVDRFKERNIALPGINWTMPEFAALAKQLTDPEKQIFGTTNSANSDGAAMFSLMWNYAKHYWVNDDETKALINDEPAIEMFRLYQDMQFKDQSIAWSGNPAKEGFGFNQGAQAMTLQYTSTASFSLAQTFEKQGFGFEWRLHTFPKGPKDQQHFSQGHLWSIAKSNKQPEHAWALTEWLGSMEAEKVYAETGHTPPQVPSAELWDLYYSKWPADVRKTAIDFILNTVYKGKAANFQYWPTYAECQPIVKAAVMDIYGPKQVPPKVAMDEAARQIDAVLQANR